MRLLFIVMLFFCSSVQGREFIQTGEAMAPSIADGEKVEVGIISSVFYTPERWDIVAINNPNAFNLLIYRIVGMPNETIEISADAINVNGKPLALPQALTDAGIRYAPASEVLGDKQHSFPQTFTTTDDEFVVLGDNTMEANDSRFDLGLVKRASILNKAKLIKH